MARSLCTAVGRRRHRLLPASWAARGHNQELTQSARDGHMPGAAKHEWHASFPPQGLGGVNGHFARRPQQAVPQRLRIHVSVGLCRRACALGPQQSSASSDKGAARGPWESSCQGARPQELGQRAGGARVGRGPRILSGPHLGRVHRRHLGATQHAGPPHPASAHLLSPWPLTNGHLAPAVLWLPGLEGWAFPRPPCVRLQRVFPSPPTQLTAPQRGPPLSPPDLQMDGWMRTSRVRSQRAAETAPGPPLCF